MTQPAINMDEYDNFYKVEVSLPGIHKEDIVIFVEDHILTVEVIHKERSAFQGRSRIHEFDMNYFERQIALPEGTEAEFATAEYKEGILTLIIPKLTEHSGFRPGRIVVY